jgi:cytochrome c-type biogenesis protein CcmH
MRHPGGAWRPVQRAALLIVSTSLAAGACTKRDTEGPSGVPPLAAAPSPAAPATPPPAPPAPPAGEPAPQAPPAEAAPADPKAAISGEIVLPAAQRANVSPTDTIFLVARRISDNPTARGTLIAVKKLSAASFPIPFTLSAADMPFQNGPFDGELTLSVRADKDGDPMTHNKGDVFGSLPKVRVGAHGVKLPLDQVQKQDESLAQPGVGGGGGPFSGHPPMGGQGLPPGHP